MIMETIIPKCKECGLAFFSDELLAKHINDTGHNNLTGVEVKTPDK